MPDTVSEAQYLEFLDALLAGDRIRCTRTVQELMAGGVGLRMLYVQVFQRAMYRVGELWEQQRISVAVEHLATAIVERMLALVQAQVFTGPYRERKAIIACVADEYHQLGGRMVADFFELHGWRGYFLGANTPLPDLMRLIDELKPDMLGLSLSIYFNLPALLRALDAVTAAYSKLPILVGGQALRWGGQKAIEPYPNVTCVASMDDLERIIAQ